MNVRNLISQFEQISQTYHPIQTQTPRTPKAQKSFFSSTPDLLENKTLTVSPTYKSNETKLEELEIKIKATKKTIGTDDPVHILFNLLVYLIEIGKIEVEGNFRAKQKKNECFDLLNQCKQDIVKTLPELNLNEEQNVEEIKDEPIICRKPLNEENVEEEVNTVQIACIKPLRQIFTNDELVINKPVNKIEEAILASNNETETDEDENEDEDEEIEVSTPLVFKSIRDLKKAFEVKDDINEVSSPKPRLVVNTKIQEDVIASHDSDGSETSTLIASEQLLDEDVTNEIDSKTEQVSVLNEISAEMDYLLTIIDTLDVFDALRIETLEESLDEFKFKLTELPNTKDNNIEDRKSKILSIVNLTIENLQKKKLGQEVNTDVFQNISKMEKDEEARNVDIFEAITTMDDLYQEVENYKNMIQSLDPADVIKIKVLKENVNEVLDLFVNFETYSEASLEERKQTGIELLDQFNNKLVDMEKSSSGQFLQTLIAEIDLYADLEESLKDSNEIRIKLVKICEILQNFEVKDDEEFEIVQNALVRAEYLLQELTNETDKQNVDKESNNNESIGDSETDIINQELTEEVLNDKEACKDAKTVVENQETNDEFIKENTVKVAVNTTDNTAEVIEPVPQEKHDEIVEEIAETVVKAVKTTDNIPEIIEPAPQETNKETLETVVKVIAVDVDTSDNIAEIIEPASQEKSEEIIKENLETVVKVSAVAIDAEVIQKKHATNDQTIKEITETDAEIVVNTTAYVTEVIEPQEKQFQQEETSNEVTIEETNEPLKVKKQSINSAPNQEELDDGTKTQLDALCAEITYYKQVAEEIDPQDAVKIDATVKHISGILQRVDKINTNDYTKKINCMRDITNILKIFGQKKNSTDRNQETSAIKRLWGNVMVTVKSVKEDLNAQVDPSKLGTILAKLMHLIELVRKEKPANAEEELLKNESLQKLEDTVNTINSNLISK